MSTPRKLQIIMPMVGLGSRFAKEGISTPKPLIEVDGMPMFRKALSSLDNINAQKSYYFVIRQEHVNTLHLDRLITDALPEAHIIVLPKLTRGAAESALAAKPELNLNDAVILLDCDLWFKSESYNKMVERSLTGEQTIAAGLLTFSAKDARYSYALIGDDNLVVRTAEKEVISHNAITGAYFFAKGSTFTEATEVLLTQSLSDTMKEYYVSYVYDVLLKKGDQVKAATVDQFASFGTPEELQTYETHTQHDILA
jgi:dTDP-glucose pyrophosphorylase